MKIQYFIIGILIVLNNIMNRIYKFKRILLYYLMPNKRNWVNWDSYMVQRDNDILEQVFELKEFQLYYINNTKSGMEYYLSSYTDLIEDT